MDFYEDAMVAHLEKMAKLQPIVQRVLKPNSSWDRVKALREFYSYIDVDEYNPYPYGMDWSQVFTPIEFQVWQDIRGTGADYWPQFPVGRFVVDFADPAIKVAIEADGARWHDEERDSKRDQDLADMGWHVYRISGSDCHKVLINDWLSVHDEWIEYGEGPLPEIVRRWQTETVEGLLAAIETVYRGRDRWSMPVGDAYRILNSRRLADFEIDRRPGRVSLYEEFERIEARYGQ